MSLEVSQFVVGIMLVALCGAIWFKRTRTTDQMTKDQYGVALLIMVPILILGFALLISDYFIHR